MTAGKNCRATIWRMVNLTDDSIGGAVISGTVAYGGLEIMLDSNPSEQILLQQGYETQNTFTATVVPGTLDIRERDELEVTEPVDSMYYQERFRIVGVQHSSHNHRDPRNYIMLDLVRSERSHTVQ